MRQWLQLGKLPEITRTMLDQDTVSRKVQTSQVDRVSCAGLQRPMFVQLQYFGHEDGKKKCRYCLTTSDLIWLTKLYSSKYYSTESPAETCLVTQLWTACAACNNSPKRLTAHAQKTTHSPVDKDGGPRNTIFGMVCYITPFPLKSSYGRDVYSKHKKSNKVDPCCSLILNYKFAEMRYTFVI